MPWLRIILAVLIGFSLAVTPVAAAIAKPMAAMEHCDKKGMGAKDMGDCPCCDKVSACAASACSSMCAKVPVALTSAFITLVFMRQAYERSTADTVALSAWPPPAPPPRA